MNKKILCALLVAAAILTTTTIAANLLIPPSTTQQAEVTPVMNPTAPPPQTAWNKTCGRTNNEWAYSVQQTSDDGYIVAGGTNSFGAGGWDFWLVKTDASGNHQWNKTYGGTEDDIAYSVQQTSDGGYIAAGFTWSFGEGKGDFWLVKTDSTGNHQWNETYGEIDDDRAYSVQQTSDNGYVVAGYTLSYPIGFDDFWLVRTNSAGVQQWSKHYGRTGTERAYSVQQTADGGYIMTGYTTSFTADNNDQFWLVKTNSIGTEQWNKTYGGAKNDQAWSVQQTADGGYIATGYVGYFAGTGMDFWLVKTNSAGDQQWNKTYGGTDNDRAYSVQQTSDGGYIVAGATNSFDIGGGDLWLVKTDGSGDHQWNKTIGGTNEDGARSVQQTGDRGYIVAGGTYSFGAGSNDFWLVKTWDETSPSTISDLAADSPTSDSITLTWTAPGDDGMKGNATGYIVKHSTIGHITAENWSSATTYPQSWKPVKNGTAEIRIVTGLTSATKYWFAVEACDEAQNCGEVSNSPSATTLPDTTLPATIANLAAGSPTITSITLTWTAPGDDGMNGNASGYVVRYSTLGAITADNWSSATTYAQSWTPAKNGTPETYEVTDLSPETKYWFAVVAYDDASPANYGGVSNSPNATTLDPGKPETISDLAAGSPTITSITLTWTAPGDNGMNGNATGYLVKCSTTGAIDDASWDSAWTCAQSWIPAKNGTTETHEVTDLSPGTKYWFAIETYDDAANYAGVSNSPNATTLDSTAPATIGDLDASSASSNSVILTWTAPGDSGMNGNATGYVVRYSTTGAIDDASWDSATTFTQSWTPAKNGTPETYEVTDLSPETKYWFAVVAYDDASPANYGGVSNSPNATTLDPGKPETISDLAAGSPTITSITLTWTAPGDNGMNGNATGYLVKYSTSGAITDANWDSATTYTQSWTPARNGTTETYVISGLTPGTQYWFAIRAYDDASPSNYGDISNSPSKTTTGGTGTEPGTLLPIILGGVAVTVAVVLVAVVLAKKRRS